MASLSGYGKSIKLHTGDGLVVHRSQDSRVVILEYEVHGEILSSGAPYNNRFISVITIENRKIINWRDYMDSLAAWTALHRDRKASCRERVEISGGAVTGKKKEVRAKGGVE